MKSTAAMESTTTEFPSEARAATEGVPTSDTPMVKTTECSRPRLRLAVWYSGTMLWADKSMLWAMESVLWSRDSSRITTQTFMMEIVAVDEGPAMGDVGVVVEYKPAAVPVESPVVPSPAKAGEEAESEAQAKVNAWSRDKESRIRIPAGPR
jgi:hypothetical protein